MNQCKGRIKKVETFATADGPGVRTVIFLAGCTLRCVYCHNPEMRSFQDAEEVTVEDLVKKLKRFKPYYKNRGGVTFCGGEPLFQSPFLIQAAKACKAEGIHVTLDTAGVGDPQYFDEVLSNIDLILFDIKGVSTESYIKLTDRAPSTAEEFIQLAQIKKIPIWIRHVVVPDINDNQNNMDKLVEIIKTIKNVERVDLLPYHTLGNIKYERAGIKNPLPETKPMDPEVCKKWQNYIDQKLASFLVFSS